VARRIPPILILARAVSFIKKLVFRLRPLASFGAMLNFLSGPCAVVAAVRRAES
jgi:hypothetical protein